MIKVGGTMSQLWMSFGYLKKYKKWTILGIVLIFFEILLDLLLPNIMSNMINIGIGKQDTGYLIIHILLMVILTIVGIIGGIGSTYYASKASGYVSMDMRYNLFQKITSFSFTQLDKTNIGNTITVLTNDITTIGSIMMFTIRILIRIPFVFLGSIIMAVLISPTLSLSLIILLPLMCFIMFILMRKAFPYFDLTQERLDDVNKQVRELVGGIRVVKSTTNESYEKAKFKKVNQNLKATNLKAIYLLITAMPVMMLLINITVIFVLWYGGSNVINHSFEIGSIMAFIQYLNNILGAIVMGSVMIVMIARSCTSARRYYKFMEEETTNNTGMINSNIIGNIEFQNVSFAYSEGSGDHVLKDINISIKEHDIIGIIGSTGSGKSTFANLIAGNYFPTEGNILLDGKSIHDYQTEAIKKQIGICFQNPTIFKGTIRSNLKLAGKFTKKELEEASKIACSYTFIMDKPNKWNYQIEQLGTNLSGGQKQRLALTRTVLQKPRILILDDSTSAVDAATEQQIINNLIHYKQHTLIIISNKISTLKWCNRIYVFDDGRIIDSGTHEALLDSCSFYKTIADAQMRGN